MIFALAGNQNCGKTTLFNALTGSNQHVGNFPGITVDQKVGEIKGSKGCYVVDLPGIYSIRSYSSEEIVTRDYILKDKPDGIINIVDATNIERNLYLTLQLLELKIPTVLALNMMDEVRNNGGTVDVSGMSERLGIPVVPISAAKNEGISELISAAINTVKRKSIPLVTDFCPPGPIHRCIHSVSLVIEDHAETIGVSPRFCATKVIEGDDSFAKAIEINENEIELIEHSVVEMESECGMDRNAALADMRYTFIESVCAATVKKPVESKEHRRSEQIDKVLTNIILALPMFFIVMLSIFYLTFGLIGNRLSDLLSLGIEGLSDLVSKGLVAYGINPVVQSLIIDGVFTGVGSVLSFLPVIVVLFFFLSILEDTGYMARVAFIMDRLLRKIGLSGKSFVPMLIGFGCTVPAVMATRTLSSGRDRKMTILLTPFMSCSAKIPIYVVFCAAFFEKYSTLVMMALYFGGMVIAVFAALLLKSSIFRGKPVPFVMELPNYRMPSLKSVLLLMWEKARDFLQRAFTVVFIATLIIWFLETFDAKLNIVSNSTDSILAVIGQFIAPIFKPLGFSDWRISTSLLAGLSAKEAVVSTLGVLTETGSKHLQSALSTIFTPLTALSFLTFTLLYTPCIAAVATIRRELGSTLKTAGVVTVQCIVAWIATLAVYNIGNIFI